MPAYQQLGDKAFNLVREPLLDSFGGVILSPVNYLPDAVASQVNDLRGRSNYDIVFDPQLYVPRSQRGQLRKWRYFPEEVDSADQSSDTWWVALADRVVATAAAYAPLTVCSPAMVPPAFTDEYFALVVRVGNHTVAKANATQLRVLQTAVVRLVDLATPGRPMAIASILSNTRAEGIYLVFETDVEPRRELTQEEALTGAMQLIQALEVAELPVLVGHTSSDMLLWKAVGATSVATGKHFNLRRYTRSRFDEPGGGGGLVAYWFEENLVAFLREPDVLRLTDFIGVASRSNPFGHEILTQLRDSPGKPWVALGWKQYLYWFADAERRATSGEINVADLLRRADERWALIESRPNLLLEERPNNGHWVRNWRRALEAARPHLES